MRLPEDPELEDVLTVYQRFAHDADGRQLYRTAVIYRQPDRSFAVIGVDGDERGESEITTHERLEAARSSAIAWTQEAREVDWDAVSRAARIRIVNAIKSGGDYVIADFNL